MDASGNSFYLPEGLPKPVPSPDGLDAPFWSATQRGELVVQRCVRCGTFRAPEWICFRCHSFDSDWVQVPGRGSIYTWERSWKGTHPALTDFGPYLIVVVEVADAGGVR